LTWNLTLGKGVTMNPNLRYVSGIAVRNEIAQGQI